MQDDLFRPTIQERPLPARRPWMPDSIVYPAFFGGPIAATVLGVLNGRRLGNTRNQLLMIVAAGVVCFGARVGVSLILDDRGALRLVGSAAGVLVWLAVLAVQRKPFRVYRLRGGEAARLWGPGFLAALVFGILEAAVIFEVIK